MSEDKRMLEQISSKVNRNVISEEALENLLSNKKVEDFFLEVASDMPNATPEEIVENAYLRVCALRGMKDYEEGKLIPHEEVMKDIYENINARMDGLC